MSGRLDFLKIAKGVIKECKKGLSEGIRSNDGRICVMAAIEVAMGESDLEKGDIGDNPSCVHSDLRNLGIALNDGNAWSDMKQRGAGMTAFAVACLNTAKHKKIKKFWDLFKIEYVRTVVPLIMDLRGKAGEKIPPLWPLVSAQVKDIKSIDTATSIINALKNFENNFNYAFDDEFPFARLADNTADSNAVMKATCKAATEAIKQWRKESADLLKACKLK